MNSERVGMKRPMPQEGIFIFDEELTFHKEFNDKSSQTLTTSGLLIPQWYHDVFQPKMAMIFEEPSSKSILKNPMNDDDFKDIYGFENFERYKRYVNKIDNIPLLVKSVIFPSTVLDTELNFMTRYSKIGCLDLTILANKNLDDNMKIRFNDIDVNINTNKSKRIQFQDTTVTKFIGFDDEIFYYNTDFTDRGERLSVLVSEMLCIFAEKTSLSDYYFFFNKGYPGFKYVTKINQFVNWIEFFKSEIERIGTFCLNDENIKYWIYPLSKFSLFLEIFYKQLEVE